MLENQAKLNLTPPADLLGRVVARLAREKRINSFRRLLFFSFSSAVSLAGIILLFRSVASSLLESGFWRFFSLLFSDFSVVMANWQNFFGSLLESLPIINLILVLALLAVFLESMKLMTKNIKTWSLKFNR